MGQRNEGFNIKKYIGWMFMAVCECMIIYFSMFALYGSALFSRDDNLLSMGTLCFTGAVVFINTKLLIIEKHNKTYLTALAYIITVAGWFVWQLFLSGVPLAAKKSHFLYPMKDDFIYGFGKDGLWWLVLIFMIACLVVFELGIRSVRKAFWPSDTDLFQQLQNDPVVRKRFEEVVRREKEGEGLEGLGMEEGEMERSKELQELKEAEIEALLGRPRVMSHGAHLHDADAQVVRSPVEVEAATFSGLGRKGSLLTRRKVSVDLHHRNSGYDGVEEIEMEVTNLAVPASRKGSVARGHTIG